MEEENQVYCEVVKMEPWAKGETGRASCVHIQEKTACRRTASLSFPQGWGRPASGDPGEGVAPRPRPRRCARAQRSLPGARVRFPAGPRVSIGVPG